MRSIIALQFAAAFTLTSLMGCAQMSNSPALKHIDQKEFNRLVKDENAIVMDVRTPGEVAEGIIKGATVFADFRAANFGEQVAKLDKSKTYIVYCRSGARSTSASQYMLGNGFTKVYNLKGGIIEWQGETTKR